MKADIQRRSNHSGWKIYARPSSFKELANFERDSIDVLDVSLESISLCSWFSSWIVLDRISKSFFSSYNSFHVSVVFNFGQFLVLIKKWWFRMRYNDKVGKVEFISFHASSCLSKEMFALFIRFVYGEVHRRHREEVFLFYTNHPALLRGHSVYVIANVAISHLPA